MQLPILRSILSKAIGIKKTIPKVVRKKNASKIQQATLLRLLRRAQNTDFGKQFEFNKILFSKTPVSDFQKKVPIYTYEKIYQEWWHKLLKEETDVCWPGKVKYFALSSGTSEGPSKYIPITNHMLRSIKRTSVRQMLTLADYDLDPELLTKGFLMIGGSTNLKSKGSYFEGDLSGITTGNVPFWFQQFYKPGKIISDERDWGKKIERIVDSAKDWDIGFICGVPAWIKIVLEKIIAKYNLKTIHDIWPNLAVYCSGGVSFEPYRQGFESLFSKPVYYIDTYLASEGFLAYQSKPNASSMQLVLNNGIFFEFIPFTESNFDEDGNLRKKPETLLIDKVKENIDYAILISTNAGSWRYLIGDTIRFTSIEKAEIIITGRTKHYMSLCGEHLSVDNMNHAIKKVAEELSISIPEFAISGGTAQKGVFSHKWYIATNDTVDKQLLLKRIDELICELNDDYAVERKQALQELYIEVLPVNVFYDWMRKNGKEGGQNKFPRVLKKEKLADWEAHITKL